MEKELAKLIDDLMDSKIDKMIDKIEARLTPKNKSALFDPQRAVVEATAKACREFRNEPVETQAAAILMGRFMKGIGLSAQYGNTQAMAMIKNMHPSDREIGGLLEKALGVSVPSDGGYTVPEITVAEMIPYLYSKVSVTRLGARRLPMLNGNMKMPRMDSTAGFYWGAENQVITKSQQVLGSVNFAGKKGTALVPVSNDLLRSASIAADLWITNDVVIKTQLGCNYAFLYGTGSANMPSGLDTLLPAAQKKGASSTPLLADIPAYMKGLLLSANVPMISLGWIFNGMTYTWLYNLKTTTGAYIYRDELNKGNLLGDPYVIDNAITTGGTTFGTDTYSDLFYGDWSEFVIGEQLSLEVTASKEATYYDGSTNVSAFANDQTVIRAITVLDCNVRHTASFVQGTYGHRLT